MRRTTKVIGVLAGLSLACIAGCSTAAVPTAAKAPAPAKTRIVYRTKVVHRTVVRQVPPPVAPPAAPAAAPRAPAQSDPWAVVSEYYGDVTSGDYYDAWGLLGPSFQSSMGSYSAFVAGYTGTGTQDVYEVSESGDTVTYYLESINPDGTTQWYDGTATVADGQMQSANLAQIAGNPNA